jgi:hypothetical protein
MADVVKTEYMDKPQRGYSEYFAKSYDALLSDDAPRPVPGDRAFLADGSMYFCWNAGDWEKIG